MTRDFSHLAQDPALQGNFQDHFADMVRANDAKPMAKLGRGVTPAAALRKRCKDAVKSLEYLGSRPLWEPRLTAGKVHFGNSKNEITVGNKGQTDVVVTWWGHAFHCEIKAGADRERPSQTEYAPKIKRSHGTRVEVRSAKDLIDAMMHWYQTHPATVAEARRA